MKFDDLFGSNNTNNNNNNTDTGLHPEIQRNLDYALGLGQKMGLNIVPTETVRPDDELPEGGDPESAHYLRNGARAADIAWGGLEWGDDNFNAMADALEARGMKVIREPHGTGPHIHFELPDGPVRSRKNRVRNINDLFTGDKVLEDAPVEPAPVGTGGLRQLESVLTPEAPQPIAPTETPPAWEGYGATPAAQQTAPIEPVKPAQGIAVFRKSEDSAPYSPGTMNQVKAASDAISNQMDLGTDQGLIDLGKGRTNFLESSKISPDMMLPGFRHEDYNAPRENGVGSEVLPAIGRGALGVVGQAGGVARLFGAEETGKEISDFADKAVKGMSTPGSKLNASKPFEWADAATVNYWTDGRAAATLGEGVGSMGAMMLASVLLSYAIPASATGAVGAGLAAAASKVLASPTGRATLGRIMQSVPAQKLAERYAQIASTPLGKKAIETFAVEGVLEGTLQGGDTTNNILNWNGAVNVLRDPQSTPEQIKEAKNTLADLVQGQGGNGEKIDFDHVGVIDDGKMRAAKEIGANVLLLSASNMLEAGTILGHGAAKAGQSAIKSALNKAADATGRAVKTGFVEGSEEWGQLGATKGVNGMGLKGTPMEGEPFVWSANPAEWNPEQKSNFMGGAMVGAPMGAAGGLIHRQPVKQNPVSTPVESNTQPQEEPKLKIGDVVPDDQYGPISLTGITPDGKATFTTKEGLEVQYEVPVDLIDPSVFQNQQKPSGTTTPAKENEAPVANPDAKVPESAPIVDSQPVATEVQTTPITNEEKIPSTPLETAPVASEGPAMPKTYSKDTVNVGDHLVGANGKVDFGYFIGSDKTGRRALFSDKPNGPESLSITWENLAKENPKIAAFDKSSVAVGDQITWNDGKSTGEILKATDSGMVIKKSDGTKTSMPYSVANKSNAQIVPQETTINNILQPVGTPEPVVAKEDMHPSLPVATKTETAENTSGKTQEEVEEEARQKKIAENKKAVRIDSPVTYMTGGKSAAGYVVGINNDDVDVAHGPGEAPHTRRKWDRITLQGEPVVPATTPAETHSTTPAAQTSASHVDKSVRDNNQQAIVKNNTVTVINKSGSKTVGKFSFTVEDWESAKRSSGNPEYGIRKFLEAKYKEAFPQSYADIYNDSLMNRIVDSGISAVKKALGKTTPAETAKPEPQKPAAKQDTSPGASISLDDGEYFPASNGDVYRVSWKQVSVIDIGYASKPVELFDVLRKKPNEKTFKPMAVETRSMEAAYNYILGHAKSEGATITGQFKTLPSNNTVEATAAPEKPAETVAKQSEKSDNGGEDRSFDSSKEQELRDRLIAKKKPKKIVNVVDDSDEALSAAVLRLRGELGKISANPVFNPNLMDAALEVGLIYTQRGVNNFADWSEKMIKSVGERVKPYLPSTWSMINNFPAGEKYDQETVRDLFEYAGIQYESGMTDEAKLSKKITSDLGEEYAPFVKMAYEGITSWKNNGGVNEDGQGATDNQLPSGKSPESVESGIAANYQEDSGTGNGNMGKDHGQTAGPSVTTGGKLDAEIPKQPKPSPRNSTKSNVGKRGGDVRNQNYIITDKDQLGKGGAVQKFNDNLAVIKLIQKLNEENRQATPAEQAILVKYVGWGGFPQLFDNYLRPEHEWYNRAQELKSVLSKEEYDAARSSTTNAHYTSETVVRAIWDGVKRLGFDGGKILEPSMGTGNFFGLMPKDLRDSKLTGIELDKLTGAIAKQLYPEANININGFEKTPIPDDYYDLAISNVPFGDYSLHDPKYNKYKLHIHNYFFLKALDKVRPGGLVVFITGSGTMQSSKQSAVRDMIAGKAELIGAVKMPNTAFKENARTEVTTDVLFLRKLMPDESPTGHAWSSLGESGIKSAAYPYRDMQINEYFVKNPDMMLGKLYEDKLHQGRLGLQGDGRDLGELMKKALGKLPKNIYQQSSVSAPTVLDVSQMIDASGSAREGSVQIENGSVFIVKSGKMVPHTSDKNKMAEVAGLIAIRENVRELMRAQINPDTSDETLSDLRDNLKKSYDDYVKKHGLLQKSKNKSLFADDPDSGMIFGLEEYTDKKKTDVKLSDLFSKRTIQASRRASDISTPEEALIATLQETGRVNIERMAALLGKSEDEVIRDLEGLIFNNPSTEKWEPADVYLSGNVRQKLIAAKEAAKTDKKYSTNVTELEKVIPEDVSPHLIKAKLGAPWISTDDVVSFVDHLLGRNNSVTIRHDDTGNEWILNETYNRYGGRSAEGTVTWGTSRYSAVDLVSDILNHRKIEVKDKGVNDEKPVVNQKETAAAQDKAEAIKVEFHKWLWSDAERSVRLSRVYNDMFNAVRLMKANGEHLQIPGLSTRISLYPHQKDAIWRIVQGGNSLIAHAVGLGKTLVMQAAGMKLRQLGLSRKPMYVIPNATVSDFETKFRENFPTAKILVISSKSLPAETPVMKKVTDNGKAAAYLQMLSDRAEQELGPAPGGKNKSKAATEIDKVKTAERIQARRSTLARIATEDWDAVIITHTMFKRLPMSPESQAEFIRQTVADYAAAIEAAKAEDGNSRYVKQLEAQKKRWEAKLEAALSADTKSIVTPFEELGIDYLFVDEADVFKNLGFATKMGRIAGVQNSDAQRSMDMYSKTSYLNKVNNGSGVVFATGTPISNTIGEMFTMMRYMIPQRLRELNMGHFDTWASNFGETIASFERDVSGKGYRTVERFAKFVNAPELIKLFREFADVKRAEDVNLPLPKLRTGSWQTIVSPMSEALKKYINEDVAKRVDMIRSGLVDPSNDNMLVVTSDLRKAALDIRLVLPGIKLDKESKIHKAVENIYRIWKDTEANRSTQIVFCDLSIPKPEKETETAEVDNTEEYDFEVEAVDASVYQTIQRMLVEKGMPIQDVVFIHDAKTNAQRQALFDKMNSGEVRVLIGSTGKAGVGLNVQNKLIAAHHLDVPWRPRDLEQRNGRIVRQGNENEEVDVYAYATEGSADSIMWDRVALKQKFIQHAMSDNLTDREIAEDDMSLGFAEIAAITSGNPLLAEKFKLENQVTRLRLLREKFESDKQWDQINLSTYIPKGIALAKQKISEIQADIDKRINTTGDNFAMSLLGKNYTERKEAEEELNSFMSKNTINTKLGEFILPESINVSIGTIGGFDVQTRMSFHNENTTTYTLTKKDGTTVEAHAGSLRLVLMGTGSQIYNVTTPTVGGLENRVRRMDDTLKLAQGELEQEEGKKVAIQKRLDTKFDREEEYQTAKAKLDKIITELSEEEKPAEDSGDGSIVLQSGANPLDLIPGLRKYNDMTAKEAIADLVTVGRSVYDSGVTNGGKWMNRMKELLGDLWAKAKPVMMKVWNQVKATLGDNRGAIRLGGRTIEASAVVVPADVQEGGHKTIEQLKEDGWLSREAGNGSTVLIKPEPEPKEVPAAFEPVIPGMDRNVAFEFDQSSTVPEIPTKEKMRELLQNMWHNVSRKYVALPNDAKFSPLAHALTGLEHAKGVATDTSVRIIESITKPLKDKKDYQIFCHKVVFDDIAADLAADEHYEMPFGLTKENFQEQYDAVNAAVTPNIQQAVDARKKAWTDFKQDYVASMKAIGFNTEDRLKKGDTYFHHIVLDYAELKQRMDPTLGSKLRTPSYRGFLKQREGTTKNILTDYLQPEMEVLGQMMYDIEIAKTIKLVSDKYDIQQDLKKIATATNDFNTIKSLIEEQGEIEGLKSWRQMSKKQAMAMNRLGQAAYNDELPNGNGKWDEVIQKLAEIHALNLSEDSNIDDEPNLSKGELFGFLNYLIKNTDGEGKMIAALMFKGISEKAKAMKERLGDELLRWQDLVPEGYEVWQPREGNLFYTGYSIPEHIAQSMAEQAVSEMGVPKDQIRKVLLQGGRRREMVVPVEVSTTLEDISPAKALRGWFGTAFRKVTGMWKQAVLHMPTRVVTYNFNNMVGDVDAVIAAQGIKAFKKTSTAMRELYGVFYRGKEMSPLMKEWFQRGGFETLLQAQEAGKINELNLFDRFMEKDGTSAWKVAKKGYMSYWNGARKATDFREAIMRYAKFLDYVEQMENNNGVPKEFGASKPENVMALDDLYDRAFKLSNELLGAYDSISAFGKTMRETVWPFWSWKEVNATRYAQMIRNATVDDKSAANVALAIGGMAMRRSPFAAVKVGGFLVKAAFLWALLQAYNWKMWPEEEKQLDESIQRTGHLILGKDADGKVNYIKVNGAFVDLLNWFGLDTPMQMIDAYYSGRKTGKQLAIESALSPSQVIAGGLTPYLKVPGELVFGKIIYPDWTKPRPMHDKGEYLAQSLALGQEYRAVFNKPHQPYTLANWGILRKSDPMKAAYYSILGSKQQYLEDKGKGEGFFNSPKSEALRSYKEALRYEDEAAAVKALEEYKLAGGTREGLERSLEAMNPISGMKKEDRDEFIKTLSPEQRSKLDLAQQYYDMVIQRSGGTLKLTKKGAVDVKIPNVDLPSEKKKKKFF